MQVLSKYEIEFCLGEFVEVNANSNANTDNIDPTLVGGVRFSDLQKYISTSTIL